MSDANLDGEAHLLALPDLANLLSIEDTCALDLPHMRQDLRVSSDHSPFYRALALLLDRCLERVDVNFRVVEV